MDNNNNNNNNNNDNNNNNNVIKEQLSRYLKSKYLKKWATLTVLAFNPIKL